MFVLIGRRRALILAICLVGLIVASVVWLVGPAVHSVASLVSGRLVPIYKVDTQEKKIAFSFDATWGTEHTDRLLEILDEHGVKTTFFLAGYWIEEHPDYVRKIAAAGHEVETHSYAHPHMNQLSKAQIKEDLEKNHALLKELTGKDPILFRPPFGEYSNKVIEVADELGYYTIQWSIDSLDWKDVSAGFMVRRVLDNLAPGEIVLFHNAGKHTPEAVEILLPELAARGYEVVPVGELIYRDNYRIDPNTGIQRRTGSSSNELDSAPTAVVPEGAVFHVEGVENMASFAVNVDWGEEHLPAMLDIFARNNVQVTFFLTGRWAEAHPELVRMMVDAGHEIANHGLTHAHPKQLTNAQLGEHILANQELLDRLTGGHASRLYAPPYGEWDERIVSFARELGFPTVLWTLDTIDWQDPSPNTIVQRVGEPLAAGNIVLMHPRRNTVEALPALIATAQAKGLKLVSIGTMLSKAEGI